MTTIRLDDDGQVIGRTTFADLDSPETIRMLDEMEADIRRLVDHLAC